MILDKHRPLPEWFSHDPYGIHGIAHVTRVLVWADQLAQAMLDAGEGVDIEVVRWAAALHDVGRWDDGRDAQHGERSAVWVAENMPRLDAKIQGARLQLLQELCVGHVRPDATLGALTDEMICLKDADGLDRVRLGDLRVEYLRTEAGRALVPRAEKLMRWTSIREEMDPWENVREIAAAYGVWR